MLAMSVFICFRDYKLAPLNVVSFNNEKAEYNSALTIHIPLRFYIRCNGIVLKHVQYNGHRKPTFDPGNFHGKI